MSRENKRERDDDDGGGRDGGSDPNRVEGKHSRLLVKVQVQEVDPVPDV